MTKEQFLKQFGKQLRKIRMEKGISIRELELRGSIDRGTLSQIENGKHNPTIYTVKKICEALEMEFQELFK